VKKNTGLSSLWTGTNKIDWKLLVFLLLFLHVKLLVKLVAVMLIYLLRPGFKFGFHFNNSKLPLFYPVIIGIAMLNWLLHGQLKNMNYNLVLASGILSWLLCILAMQQVKLAVQENDPEVVHRTILVFFLLNALVSLAIYAGIVWETGAVNPYRYQGDFQKYFIGTGDYIKGISFDTSTTNAVLNAFGVIYFLSGNKYLPAILCMAILLLTGSNITSFLLCLTLLFIFFFRSNRDQKSIIVVCLLMLVVFFVKVSPQNNTYVTTAYQRIFNKQPKQKQSDVAKIPVTQRPDSILSVRERKEKIAQLYMDSVNMALYEKKQAGIIAAANNTLPVIQLSMKPVIPVANIHTATFQHRDDTSQVEKKLLQFVAQNNKAVPVAAHKTIKPKLPGKLIALQQTWRYMQQYPLDLVTGTGIGNFSSKLAFRVTAMKITGNYPERYAYLNPAFESNHLDLHLFYFTSKEEMHSIANSPNNTYDQLLAEYGLAGICAFVFLYIGFFVRQIKRYSYGIPLLLFMLGIFFVDYWFEQLSVVVFFELLLLLNIKELKQR